MKGNNEARSDVGEVKEEVRRMIGRVETSSVPFLFFLSYFFVSELSGLFTLTFINYSCDVAGRRRTIE